MTDQTHATQSEAFEAWFARRFPNALPPTPGTPEFTTKSWMQTAWEAALSERAAIEGTGRLQLAIRLKRQRDGAAEALREVMTWIENWDPNFAGDSAWADTQAKVEKALAECPTPEEQLDNIFKGMLDESAS